LQNLNASRNAAGDRKSPNFLRKLRLVLIISLTSLLIWIVSPTTITPPVAPKDAVTVFVLDPGFHSEIVLPISSQELIQYAYGDWHYFALNQQGWLDAIRAVLLPSQGALGRRRYANEDDLRRTARHLQAELLQFQVAQLAVDQLLEQLDRRYEKNRQTQIYNSKLEMTFVQDDADYSLVHNCNHEVAKWLQQLGCRVDGSVILANFQLN
jgi:hypothetical protein